MFSDNEINIINFSMGNGPVKHGKEMLLRELKKHVNINEIKHWKNIEKGYTIIMGLVENKNIKRLLDLSGIDISKKPEGIVYQWCDIENNKLLVIAGTDIKGLMYGLLDLSREIKHMGINGLLQIKDSVEFPEVKIRGANRFLMGPLDNSWFYSQEFWHYYLRRLALYRYNRFVLITGFDTGYMSPPYSYFVKVPGYEKVSPEGVDRNKREKNIKQLRKIGHLCSYYGINFYFSTWQQVPWTDDQKQMITGISKDEKELSLYCARGLKTLLGKCPEIDGVQLRVNLESGVGTRETNEYFWKKIIKYFARHNNNSKKKVKLALRAKGLTDHMIDYTQKLGIDLEVPTKYWCEHLGLPYHVSKMRSGELKRLDDLNHSRRYSYSDLLEKPLWFDMIYRLWNIGSSNILLWGDPDYARRFVNSIKPGQAKGFEITDPLSMKGGRASIHKNNWSLYKDEKYRLGKWENERYWFWYLVFGRIGYNPATDKKIWMREFNNRFGTGEIGDLIEKTYRAASKILPLITAFHMPRHPALIYWVELSTGGALFSENNYNKDFGGVNYINTEPSEPGLFYSIDQYTSDLLKEEFEHKYTPLQTGEWLKNIAQEIDNLLNKLEQKDISFQHKNQEIEFLTSGIDFKILKNLALFHSEKIKSAVNLSLYQKTERINYLKQAHNYYLKARKYWEEIVAVSDGVYNDDLIFGTGVGPGRKGHWKDRLIEINRDLEKLEMMLIEKKTEKSVDTDNNIFPKSSDCFSFSIDTEIPDRHSADEDLYIKLTTGGYYNYDDIKIHYRKMNQLEGSFNTITMEKDGQKYRGIIPEDYLDEKRDLLIYFSTIKESNCLIYPGINNPEILFPYFMINII